MLEENRAADLRRGNMQNIRLLCVNVELGEGDGDVVVIEENFHLALEHTGGNKDVCLIAVGGESQHDGGVSQILNALIFGSCLEQVGVSRVDTLKLGQDSFLDLADIVLVADADVADSNGGQDRTVLDVSDVGVVDDLEVAARILNRGGADADLLDGAAEVVEDDDVVDIVVAFKDDEEAGDHVLDKALRAEAYDQS